MLSLALAMGLLFHGASFFHTLEGTYDFYVHSFFGDHYARSWFDVWETRWYTGFNVTSYPPLSHQLIGLFSLIGGIKFGAFTLSFLIIILYITGAYRFAKLVTGNEHAAGYAALIAVFLPSVVEAFHVFGQIPSMLGISWLLHTMPEVYLWIRYGKRKYLRNGLCIIAVAVSSHHVTPIFGMVFFILPLIGTAVLDAAREKAGSYSKIGFTLFIKEVRQSFGRIVIFGLATIALAIVVILPYWLWSKSDPILQVPIPHGSRDNYFEVFSSGLIFFIIPWGFLLVLLPYIFYRYFSKRNIFIGLSFALLTILGTGGSTPIAKALLGENAFNILTLERFTFWATIWAMPMAGEFIWSFFNGPIRNRILLNNSQGVYNFLTSVMVIVIFCSAGLTLNLGYFRPIQPKPINIEPLTNFINTDKHYKWRYLTLGFGDQMAWLSANTNAQTIDGNYHSVRRIPELTTRAVERLENVKYRGTEGLGTLKQFLSYPDKFHLKYIFSNDKFYDPLLYFSGWHRVRKLDNGIMVWEREDVSPLPSVLPRKETPTYQVLMWGLIPMTSLLLALFFNVQLHWINHVRNRNKKRDDYLNPETISSSINNKVYLTSKFWFILMVTLTGVIIYKLYFSSQTQNTPSKAVFSYYDALDLKKYEKAYSYLDADKSYPLDQFMLEISVTDGIIESYGKIDEISTTIINETDSTAIVDVLLKYITPLDIYEKKNRHLVFKIESKWHLEPQPLEYTIPANQFVISNITDYRNQGRKKVTIEETHHTDIIDRPVLNVLQANLIREDNSHYIVGLLQNVDAYPTDISLLGKLYGTDEGMIAETAEQLLVTHKLLPKEITPFKIEFDSLSYGDQYGENVCDFSLEIVGAVTSQDLYKDTAIKNLTIDGSHVSGEIFNQGNEVATVIQALIPQFDIDFKIIDVSSQLVEESVFPRRSQPFAFTLKGTEHLHLISSTPKAVLVNGVDNKDIVRKYQTDQNTNMSDNLWSTRHQHFSIKLNNFIGNPGKF